MKKYYFIGTMLPSLSFDEPPEISFAELEVLLRENLSQNDYEKTAAIRQFFDILNLRLFWLGEELDPKGDLSPQALEEALISRVGLPDYVYDFVDTYPKIEDRIHHFPFLLSRFFQSVETDTLKDPFLRRYLAFERELRLVMTAFRAKKLKRDLSYELQYENPEEEIIAQILAQQDAKTYEPPEKYQDLKALFDKYGDDPLALQKAIDEYRFAAVENFVDMADTFSIERILAYFIQFIIVEKWFQLDKAKGMQMIDTLVKEQQYHETRG
jgi:Protein of unknown function (DUF2764)